MNTQEQAKLKQQVKGLWQELNQKLNDEELSLFSQILDNPKERDRLLEALDKTNPKPSVPNLPKGSDT